jgi:hypothetical protein
MKTIITAMVIAGAVASLSTAAVAQRSRYPQNSGQVSQEAYNYCYQLGLKRGQNTSVGDRWNFEQFIAACLAGKIK